MQLGFWDCQSLSNEGFREIISPQGIAQCWLPADHDHRLQMNNPAASHGISKPKTTAEVSSSGGGEFDLTRN